MNYKLQTTFSEEDLMTNI